jgi:hypothetical protein
MIRPSDVLFAILVVVIAAMLSLHMAVIIAALLGAFACGSIYVFAGMIPSRTESFSTRAFVSVFLSVVAASIVLILPGTFGPNRPNLEKPVTTVAALLPFAAFCFEVLRTPGLFAGVLRWLAGVDKP